MRPVRLRHAWQQWSKGHVFTAMPAAQAQVMVASGQAEYADEQPAPYVDRQLRPAARVGQGRRRA